MMRYVALIAIMVQLFFAATSMADVVNVAEPSLESRYRMDQRPVRVVTTVKPVHSLVSMVTEELGLQEPQLLLDGPIDPHHFSLKPSQARMLEQADIVFLANPEVEVFLQKRIANNPRKYYALFPAHAKYANGSHGWLSPYLASRSLLPVKQILMQEFESREPLAAAQQIEAKQKTWRKALAAYQGREVWVDHAYFDIFARYYGLVPKTISKALYEAEPGQCILLTHGANPRLQRLAQKGGHTLMKLDLLGTNHEAGVGQYFKLMDKLVDKVGACWG